MRKVILTLFMAVYFSLNIFSQINTDRVLIMGRSALSYEDYVLAISYFNKVIRVKPYLADPYYFRAYAKYSLDDFNGAKLDMTEAIDINPFHSEFFRFRGDINNRLGDYKEALADYKKGLEIDPNSIGIYFNRGLVNMTMKRYADGESDFTDVINRDNTQYGAYINRSISRLNQKDTLGAINDMEEAILVNPLVADAHKFSAAIYYELNNFDLALERINEAINLDYKQAMYYMLRGAIRYQTDNLRGTLEDFNRFVELEPRNPMGYSNRGILRVEIGDINNAIDDFSRVLAINPNDLLTLFNRSLLYLQVGELNEAASDLSLIIDAYPDYANAYMARSQAYQKLGKNDLAQKDYNMAAKLEIDKRNKANKEGDEPKKGKAKPKKTRSEKDEDINNYDKIAVLDDFGLDEAESDEVDNIRGKIQNRNIVIDMEPMFGLTFFSVDSLVNRTRYFKPEVTQFNMRKKFGRPLIFSNREVETDGEKSLEYFKTIEDITAEIKTNNDPYSLKFIRGILYGVVLNYSSALADYNNIIKNNAEVGHFPYFNRAYTRFKMVEVMQSFNEDDMPDNLLGNSLSKPGVSNTPQVTQQTIDYDLIERDLLVVIEKAPQFEFAYYNLGILKCIRKDYEGALKSFDKALEINPFFAEAYFNRGLTKIFLKDDDGGTLDLSKAGELGLYKAYNVIKRYGAKKDVPIEEEE